MKVVAKSASATALQRNILFHCPKKSAVLAMGQNKLNGTTHAVAAKTFCLFFRLAEKHAQIIDPKNTLPKIRPTAPASPNS